MSLKPPNTGTGLEKDAADLPIGDSSNHDTLDSAATSWPTRPTRSTGSTRPHAIKPNDPAAQAIIDAQEGLSSLFKPQTSQADIDGPATHDSQPHIISPSGATRNQSRGRIAGPTATPISKPHNVESLAGYLASGSDSPSSSSLSLSIDSYEDLGEIKAVPQTRLDLTVTRGKEQIEVIRQRANLLIGPDDSISGTVVESAAMQSNRRAAARWVTRYATHIVIVLVVGLMVTVGGLAGLTQGNSIGVSSDASLGTDHIDGDDAAINGQPSADSSNFDLTLPRTELGSTITKTDPATGAQTVSQPVTTVTKYTVAKGDTIQSVAKAFNVMPETIMGSNGIFDASQDLTPGDTLNIPPIDGMYYVPAAGDTIEGVAHRYGVDPEVISAYAPNNIKGGVVAAGQPLIVPGGMMPERQVTLIYTVAPGDTLRDIAARFGVDVPTMIHSNNIPNPDSLQIGSELRVLPVQGIEYKIKKGDTLRTIADRTGVSIQMITDYAPNDVSADSILQIDQVLLVPGGSPPPTPQPQIAVAVRPQTSSTSSKTTSNTSSTTKTSTSAQKVKPKVEVAQTTTKQAAVKPTVQPKAAVKTVAKTVSNSPKVGTGKMMWPVQGRITQYFSAAHNGLDIAIAAGTPIHAADSGK